MSPHHLNKAELFILIAITAVFTIFLAFMAAHYGHTTDEKVVLLERVLHHNLVATEPANSDFQQEETIIQQRQIPVQQTGCGIVRSL